MRIFSKGKDFNVSDSGISTVEMIEINGIRQAILIQAERVDNPVLLFFHGGPGMPVPGVSSRSRDYTVATTTKELVKHYVLVFWDQRGTGKSYHPDIPKESMNLKQFVSDAEGVVDYLRKHFNRDKILIAGHSWGSIIGLSLASRIPDKLYSYVGISQIVNWPENDRLSREWALTKARRTRNKKAIKALTQLGEPPYRQSFEQWGVLRKWLMKFNSMIYTDNTVKHPGMKRVILDMLRSPDYSLGDIYNTFYKGFRLSYTQQMIEDFSTVDFVKSTVETRRPGVLYSRN